MVVEILLLRVPPAAVKNVGVNVYVNEHEIHQPNVTNFTVFIGRFLFGQDIDFISETIFSFYCIRKDLQFRFHIQFEKIIKNDKEKKIK